jgi:hypothetical protein
MFFDALAGAIDAAHPKQFDYLSPHLWQAHAAGHIPDKTRRTYCMGGTRCTSSKADNITRRRLPGMELGQEDPCPVCSAMPRTVNAVGRIVPTPFLGRLDHLYVRV